MKAATSVILLLPWRQAPRGSPSKASLPLRSPTLACSPLPNPSDRAEQRCRHELTVQNKNGKKEEDQTHHSSLSCLSLGEEHKTNTKGSEAKQCHLTRHHWLIISNLPGHNFFLPSHNRYLGMLCLAPAACFTVYLS